MSRRKKDVQKLCAELAVDLPASYVAFLGSLEERKRPQELAAAGKEWRMATVSGPGPTLLDEVDLDGRSTPFAYQLASAAAMLQEVTGQSATFTADDEDFPFERLAACVTIGEGNGDCLFLDPSDGFSVWGFWHDGGDVERFSDSFDEWLSLVKGTGSNDEADLEAPPAPQDGKEMLLSTWKPVHLPEGDDTDIADGLIPTLRLEDGGKAIEVFWNGGSSIEYVWSVQSREGRLHIAMKSEALQHTIRVMQITRERLCAYWVEVEQEVNYERVGD